MATPEDKIKELGIDLSNPPAPAANYVSAVTTGNLVYLSGQGPKKAGPVLAFVTGKVGKDLSVEEGYEAARLVAITLIAQLKKHIGDLNRVKRVVKLLGLVNSAAGFTESPKVINGASDLLVQVFGEKGKHARSAIGVCSLPSNIAVEIEMIVEIEPPKSSKL